MSRRSPWRLPRPPGPDAGPKPDEPLLRLLLAAAWRPRALAVSLAAALGRIPDVSEQLGLHERIGRLLAASGAAARLAAERGLQDGETAVAVRLESVPLPTCASWAEAALAEATFGAALELGFAALAGSADPALATLGGEHGPGSPWGAETLAALAADADNRPCLQILVDRWMPASVRCFGRPGNANELDLLEARIKRGSAEEALAAFLADTETRLGALGLWLPDAHRMGVTVPSGWTPRRGSRS